MTKEDKSALCSIIKSLVIIILSIIMIIIYFCSKI